MTSDENLDQNIAESDHQRNFCRKKNMSKALFILKIADGRIGRQTDTQTDRHTHTHTHMDLLFRDRD